MQINFSVISENLAHIFGDNEAIVNIERNRRYSFREYHLLTNQIANTLSTTLNIKGNDKYLCLLRNDNLSIMSVYTAFKAQGQLCYSNFTDSNIEHFRQISFLKPKVIFIEAELFEAYHEPLLKNNVTIVVMDPVDDNLMREHNIHYFWDIVNGADDTNPNLVFDDRDDVKVVRFTGGTTGQEKCAQYSIDNWQMCRESLSLMPGIDWDKSARTIHIAPLSHGTLMIFLPTLFGGGANITMNTPDLQALCNNIIEEKVTHTFLVPTILYRLLEFEEARNGSFSSLKNVIYGAAPMSPSKLSELQTTFGNIFTQLYAATEHPCASISLSKEDHYPINGDTSHFASAGKTVPGVEVIIADDNGISVPQGEIGEIWLRSRATCLGYLGNPEKTAEEFKNDSWRSGDLGRMDENGFIYLVDRKKDLIITGGFNVYASEVEAAINSHPSVLISVTVGVPDEDWGEAVYAEIILKDGKKSSETEMKDFIRNQLGPVKTPKTVKFVDELPLSSVGKVLRRKVREKIMKQKK